MLDPQTWLAVRRRGFHIGPRVVPDEDGQLQDEAGGRT